MRAAEGYYVSVRDGGRAGLLLGPLPTLDAAAAEVDRVYRAVRERWPASGLVWFGAFGTAYARARPGHALPAGRLNDWLLPEGVRASSKNP